MVASTGWGTTQTSTVLTRLVTTHTGHGPTIRRTQLVTCVRLYSATGVRLYEQPIHHHGSGTFKQYRDNLANHDIWEEFPGIPIKWELETAWTDFKERKANKQIELVSFDTEGRVSSSSLSTPTPSALTSSHSNSSPIARRSSLVKMHLGSVLVTQPYGGGRNTRQEWLRGMPVYGKIFRLRFAGESVEATAGQCGYPLLSQVKGADMSSAV